MKKSQPLQGLPEWEPPTEPEDHMRILCSGHMDTRGPPAAPSAHALYTRQHMCSRTVLPHGNTRGLPKWPPETLGPLAATLK